MSILISILCSLRANAGPQSRIQLSDSEILVTLEKATVWICTLLLFIVYAPVECKASYLTYLFLTPKNSVFETTTNVKLENINARDTLSAYSNYIPPLKAPRKTQAYIPICVSAEN